MDEKTKAILDELQRGIPIDKRPFSRIAEKLNMKEKDVLEVMNKLEKSGIIRRFGGVFNSAKMGYIGTLCAMDVPKELLEKVADFINGFPEVTHNYERDGRPNLWFTITARGRREIENIKTKIKERFSIEVIELPTVKTYKINLFLPMSEDA